MRLATVPIGRLELVGDHAVGLVAREEAIEQLAARLVEARECIANVHRLLDVHEPVRRASSSSPSSAAPTACRRDPVEAETPRHLRDPRPDRLVVPQRPEPLVDAKERVLEDILGVRLGEPEPAHGDRVHVPRVPLDELAPRRLVACAAAGDEPGIVG